MSFRAEAEPESRNLVVGPGRDPSTTLGMTGACARDDNRRLERRAEGEEDLVRIFPGQAV
jgi:hypothetical protein